MKNAVTPLHANQVITGSKVGLQQLASYLNVKPSTIRSAYLKGKMDGACIDKEGNLQFRVDWLISLCPAGIQGNC